MPGLARRWCRQRPEHTAATWLRVGRADVRAAADLLGMSVQAAVRIYGQWTLEGQDTAADELGYGKGLKADVFVGGKAAGPDGIPRQGRGRRRRLSRCRLSSPCRCQFPCTCHADRR